MSASNEYVQLLKMFESHMTTLTQFFNKLSMEISELRGEVKSLSLVVQGLSTVNSSLNQQITEMKTNTPSKGGKAVGGKAKGSSPSINNAFKELYSKEPQTAINVFGIQKQWIEEIENSPIVKGITDPLKKSKQVASDLWKLHFNTDPTKEAAKAAYATHLKNLGVGGSDGTVTTQTTTTTPAQPQSPMSPIAPPISFGGSVVSAPAFDQLKNANITV
jgi:hypothetical protein